MDAWLEIVVRQFVLYSLPVLISLTSVTLFEARLTQRTIPHPFFSLSWSGTWLPWLTSILFTRGIIIAMPQPLHTGSKPALSRLIAHLILGFVGFAMYSWSLDHQPPTGLPPLHHWWAKVLMFFNLCMAALHLLPLPGMWLGEHIFDTAIIKPSAQAMIQRYQVCLFAILAASPVLDWLIGGLLVFPVYAYLANLA